MRVERDERGFAFIHVMILCAMVALAAAATLQRSSTLALDNRLDGARLRAHHAAEGGLAVARRALRSEKPFASRVIEVGVGAVAVTMTETTKGQWVLRARARWVTRGDESVQVTLVQGIGRERWYRVER